ncbi:imidazolonepropionase [Spongiactinospora sp. TRM90649]|uniref:imidazolonepropionase n=1 Tax=Spongiactinospora sp. TRM90649 TaxID=3031114 RepID=UPI0023F7E869|nr:imidazolonepropionase [Spongiactinospora sp. TRM90649]MDF5757723.1 imidazolonepropionase [Spongiactinospora sp. TRM90649]
MSGDLSSGEAPTPVDLVVVHAAEVLTCRAASGRGVRGAALGRPERLADGALAIDGGRIVAVGGTAEILARHSGREVIDATGRLVTPGFVDAHTHLVHEGFRHEEWGRKVLGVGGGTGGTLGGGIEHTARVTGAAGDRRLRDGALARLDTMLAHGTTTAEAKSGYGLTPVAERRILEITAALDHPIDLVGTFLGAHVPPRGVPRDRHLAGVVAQLPEVRHLAEFCDVCCDPAGFTPAECLRIANAAHEHGYRLRVHADQTGHAGGAELAIEIGAASADHLEHVSDRAIGMFGDSATVATLLPGVSYHLMDMVPAPGEPEWSEPRRPWLARRYRRLIDAGALVALATDYNPGSSPTLSMQTVMQLSARLYRLGYGEAWHMSTINAAVSLGRDADIGSLEPGKRADVVIWTVPSHEMVVNQFGVNLVASVIKDGAVVHGAERPVPVASNADMES